MSFVDDIADSEYDRGYEDGLTDGGVNEYERGYKDGLVAGRRAAVQWMRGALARIDQEKEGNQ